MDVPEPPGLSPGGFLSFTPVEGRTKLGGRASRRGSGTRWLQGCSRLSAPDKATVVAMGAQHCSPRLLTLASRSKCTRNRAAPESHRSCLVAARLYEVGVFRRLIFWLRLVRHALTCVNHIS